MLDQIKELGAAFQGLKISGATVNGDTASFESVTTEPALAADVVVELQGRQDRRQVVRHAGLTARG